MKSVYREGKWQTKVLHQLRKRGYQLVCLTALKPTAEINWRGISFLKLCPSQIRPKGGLLAKPPRNLDKLKWGRASLNTSKKKILTLFALYSQHIFSRKVLYCSCALVKKNASLIGLIPLAILPNEKQLSYTTELCKSYGEWSCFLDSGCKLLKKTGKWNKNQR